MTWRDWQRALRWFAALAVAGGVVLYLLHPHISYEGKTASGKPHQYSGQCISPWNSWSEHYDARAKPGTIAAQNQNVGDQACQTAIQGRDHEAWTLGAAAVLLVGISCLPRARESYAQRQPGERL